MKPYNIKYLWKCLIVLAMMMTFCKYSQGVAIAIALPFLMMAFIRKKAEAQLFWLMFIIISVIINSFFIPKGSMYGVIQRGSLMVIGFMSLPQFIGQRKNKILVGLSGIFIYIAYMILPSATGWWPMVSFLKMFLFSIVFLAMLGIANSIMQSRSVDIRNVRSVFLAFSILFIFGSIVLMPFPAIGQLSGKEYEHSIKYGREVMSLFKGMTTQSQALGPVVSTIGIFLITDLIFGVKKIDWLYGSLILCAPCLIYTTSSRTAMGSFLIGCAVSMMMFLKARNVSKRWRGKVTTCALCIIASMGIVVAFSPGVQNSVVGYVLKNSTDNVRAADMTFENTISSRQALIDNSMVEFKKKPMFGNGFQVDRDLVEQMGNVEGLILSAPIEKGVWITAILQEGGVVGFIIYICFLFMVVIKMMQFKCHYALSMFIVLNVVNLGEFTLFSMSGMGGFQWAMVILGVVMDEVRLRGLRAGCECCGSRLR